MGGLVERTRQAARKVGWYFSTLMGDNHYRRYVEHRARTHPGEPVLCERDYWKMRHRKTDADPGARCC